MLGQVIQSNTISYWISKGPKARVKMWAWRYSLQRCWERLRFCLGQFLRSVGPDVTRLAASSLQSLPSCSLFLHISVFFSLLGFGAKLKNICVTHPKMLNLITALKPFYLTGQCIQVPGVKAWICFLCVCFNDD